MGRSVDPDLAEQRRRALAQLLLEWKERKRTRAELAAKMPQKSAKAMLSQWVNGHYPMDDESARAVERAAGLARGALDGALFADAPASGAEVASNVQSLTDARDQITASVIELMERTDVGGRRACFRAVVLALEEYEQTRKSRASGGG